MKHAILAAVLVLGVSPLAGCGGGGDDAGKDADAPPTTASTEDFCGTFEDLIAELGKLGNDAEPAEAVKVLKETGDDLAEIGTPSDMPDDARSGWEYVLDEIDKLDSDATREDINNLGSGATDEQKANMDAYQSYLDKTCAEQLGGADPQ